MFYTSIGLWPPLFIITPEIFKLFSILFCPSIISSVFLSLYFFLHLFSVSGLQILYNLFGPSQSIFPYLSATFASPTLLLINSSSCHRKYLTLLSTSSIRTQFYFWHNPQNKHAFVPLILRIWIYLLHFWHLYHMPFSIHFLINHLKIAFLLALYSALPISHPVLPEFLPLTDKQTIIFKHHGTSTCISLITSSITKENRYEFNAEPYYTLILTLNSAIYSYTLNSCHYSFMHNIIFYYFHIYPRHFFSSWRPPKYLSCNYYIPTLNL